MNSTKDYSILTLLSVVLCGFTTPANAEEESDWKIKITPRIVAKLDTAQEGADVVLPPVPKPTAKEVTMPEIYPADRSPLPDKDCCPQLTTYKQIYDSIPFSRAEYVANPSYRHETTLSLMLGEPVITNGPKTVPVRNRPAVQYLPWSRRTFGYPGTSYLFPNYFRSYHGPIQYPY